MRTPMLVPLQVNWISLHILLVECLRSIGAQSGNRHFAVTVYRHGIELLKERLRQEQQSAGGGKDIVIVVVAGVCSDETVESYKRRPILTLQERAAALRSCRYA